MISSVDFSLRVNGLPVEIIKVRRQIQSGQYNMQNEIVIRDPLLGDMPIDEGFDIEVKNIVVVPETPTPTWQKISYANLYQRLLDIGAIPKF